MTLCCIQYSSWRNEMKLGHEVKKREKEELLHFVMMRDAQICWTRDGGRTKCIIKMPFLDFFEILKSTVIDPFR